MAETFAQAVRRRRRNLQYAARGLDLYEEKDGALYVGKAVDGHLARRIAAESGRFSWVYDTLARLYVHGRLRRQPDRPDV